MMEGERGRGRGGRRGEGEVEEGGGNVRKEMREKRMAEVM